MSQLVLDLMEHHSGHPIKRKAIDVSGRLSSLYDALTDNLINRHSTQASETKHPDDPSICRIFSGNQPNAVIDYLKWMDFDDAHRQSILFGMIKLSGVSSVINYNQPIDENTHFLYYSYRSREEQLNVIAGEADWMISTGATHMITEIVWGFEILCVLPTPDHQSSTTVDNLLQSISIRLKKSECAFVLTDTEKQQIRQLINVTVYGSETCIDSPRTSLLTVLTSLGQWQGHTNFHHPIKYTMCSLRCLYNNTEFPEVFDLTKQTNSEIAELQSTIRWLDNWSKYFQRSLENLPEKFPSPTLDHILKDIKHHLNIWLTTYSAFQDDLRKVLVDVRRHLCKSTGIHHVLSNQQYSSLKATEVKTFGKATEQLFTKAGLIQRLNTDRVQYLNVLDISSQRKTPMTLDDIDTALQRSSFEENKCLIIWYASDRLKHEDEDIWEQIYQNLIFERNQSTRKATLIYADFSQCQQDLKDFVITRLAKQSTSEPSHDHTRESERPLSSAPELQRPPERLLPISSLPVQRPSPSVTDINVLLLGETGVGKSTFINAFVNYLVFNTLQQAEQDEPIVLIPVSFLITTGDQFDEVIVKLGDGDTNENHEHQGESVTQQCKSYLFHLNDTLRLRLIDTPGMGDTRGVDQDVKNIDHILTYVNNLPHLNAVCLLLKPNTSRLNVFFRSCINQLLTYLTPIGYNNIIFCFTNARSTFFAPGNTGPLLRQMLKQEHLDDIPFQKTNTFCFDSESFRYLAARKRDIDFDDFQKDECIKSWTTSVTESVRLLHFIQTRKPYHLDEWQSPRKFALEISLLARPLMETLRLILYNWKLREVGLVDKEMTLNSNPVTTEICTNCAQASIVPVGSFWLVEYGSAKNSAVKQCMCPFNERHFVIEATVKHKFVNQPIDLSSDALRNSFHNFLFKCDRLTHFLRQKGLLNQDDPFTPILKRFLDEEQQISENLNTNLAIDKTVKEILRSVRQLREQNTKRLFQLNEELSLSEVYRIIDEIKSIRAVNQQVESIKTGRHLMMEANEYQVKIPSTINKTFAQLTSSPQ